MKFYILISILGNGELRMEFMNFELCRRYADYSSPTFLEMDFNLWTPKNFIVVSVFYNSLIYSFVNFPFNPGHYI